MASGVESAESEVKTHSEKGGNAALKHPQAVSVTKRKEEADLQQKGLGGPVRNSES